MASFRKSGINRPQKAPFINGAPISDAKFKSRPGVIVPNRVFVGGICPSATENDLLGLFGKYGSVKAVKIICDQNGSSKGYGFVTYEKADDVTRLQNDTKNLIFNDRRLNIAPAVMKNPPFVGRYPDSYVVPVTPSNIYFANNIPYQYQEGNTVFPSGPYPPPLTVLPAVSDAAYFQNGYSSSPNFIPATPYQGTALFYPVPHNTSPVMVGPQSYNSSYQSATVSNSNYIYSSPAPATSSPPTSSAKTSNAVASVTNTSDVHGSHATQMVATAPPNVSSVPPPLPYPLAHPPQYYNGGTVAPPYSGEVYYNIQGACYPVMTVGGHDAYIPYYDVPENCANNAAAEENNYESQNYHGPTTTPATSTTAATINSAANYADVNGKDNSSAVANDAKQLVPLNIAPAADQHAPESYAGETNNAGTPQTPHAQHAEYNGHANYATHRGAIIYPNTPLPPANLYFNSMYMTEAATPNIAQSPYPKNLSEHYVSDHLPKRDSKYAPPKRYQTSPPLKDNPPQIPNIPKFPFYVNNNYPGYVNRNVKEKEYQKNGNTKIIENKQPQRPPRSNSNGSGGPKPRVFHNQNQFVAGPRPQRNGGVQGNPNVPPYPRSSSVGPARSYDPAMQHNVRAYEYHNSYQKNNSVYENKRLNQTNGGYRAKYEKMNGQTNTDTYAKNAPCEERAAVAKMYVQNEETATSALNNNTINAVATVTATGTSVNENNNTECCNTPEPNDENDDNNVQVQVCKEMQNLAL